MFKPLFLFTILFAFSIHTHAQHRFEIGVEGGPTKCYYQIKESQDNLRNVPCVSGFGGATIRYTKKKNLFIEFGVLFSEYTVGFKLKQQIGFSTGNSDDVMLLPFRVGHPFNLSEKFSVVTSAGITTTIKTLNQGGAGGGGIENNINGTYSYEYKFRENSSNVYFLFNGNISAEWKIAHIFKFTAGIGYYKGLSQNNIADIKYTIPSTPQQSGELISRGSFLAYTFGLKYLLK